MADAGRVYLVGAGPGDPGLITVRGREILARADIVIYDSLVDEALLAHAPQADTIFAGKRSGLHAFEQDDINRLLVDHARQGQCVVRLKGGDPFIFGRGGEEILALAAAGISFEIVPGVSSAFAAAAYAGIPPTHRGISSRVTILSAHDLDTWDIANTEGTLIVFMGAKRIGAIAQKLIDNGWPLNTPMAAIRSATTPGQRTTVCTIATAHESQEIASPAIIIVGEVVSLHDRLDWFENRPLFGKRVAIARTASGTSEVVRLLRERGADVMELGASPATARADINLDLNRFDWIVLPSPNAVSTLFEQLDAQNLDPRALHKSKLCTIGGKASELLRNRGLRPDVSTDRYETERVIEALRADGGAIEGCSVLILRADAARSDLAPALRAIDLNVTEHRMATKAILPNDTAQRFEKFAPDYVVFLGTGSPRRYAEMLGDRAANDSIVFAAIGERAANAAREAGFNVGVIPQESSALALVEALAAFDAQR